MPIRPSARRGGVVVAGLVEPLTERELQVLKLLAAGASNRAIANQLVVTPETVKKHLSHLFDKLDTDNRTQAVTRAVELGLLPKPIAARYHIRGTQHVAKCSKVSPAGAPHGGCPCPATPLPCWHEGTRTNAPNVQRLRDWGRSECESPLPRRRIGPRSTSRRDRECGLH